MACLAPDNDATHVRPTGLLMLIMLTGCVPEGPATGSDSTREAGSNSSRDGARQLADPKLTDRFSDDFERALLGTNWRAAGAAFRIKDGMLCARGANNRGVWLTRRLPLNASIKFKARADSADGDIKVEVWGDGASGASGVSYDDATSYIVIFGGWKNRRHVLARLDEHAPDTLSVAVGDKGGEGRYMRVEKGRTYRFEIERRDGHTLQWRVDGILMHQLDDRAPLGGKGHDHFAFNNWVAPVCFDDLEITPLMDNNPR